jgi:hypothetical protein
MGLVVSSLSHVPLNADRDYFIYLLRGGWDSALDRVLESHFMRFAQEASETRSAIIAGLPGNHFENEVFSWHGINGENGEEALPAILLTTVHPKHFQHEGDPFWKTNAQKDYMQLIPLKKWANSADDVIALVQRIFSDIKEHKELRDFTVVKEIRRTRGTAFMDGVVLQPNFLGCGIDLKKMAKAVWGKGEAKT